MNQMKAFAIVNGVQEATEDEQIEAWQYLVDSGMINTLPGTYGRQAQDMIDAGLISIGGQS